MARRLSVPRAPTRAAAAALGIAAALVLLAPAAAQAAVCVPPRPVPMLADADAAFIGRYVGLREGRYVYAVERSVKGDLGAEVELAGPTPGFFTSADLQPQPGVLVGLFLLRGEDGLYRSNVCLQVEPVLMHAAADNPDAECRQPRVRKVRFRRPGRLDVLVTGLDDRLNVLRVDWGDGSVRRARARPRGGRDVITVRHRYSRRRDVYTIRLWAASRPRPYCGAEDEFTPQRILRVRVR